MSRLRKKCLLTLSVAIIILMNSAFPAYSETSAALIMGDFLIVRPTSFVTMLAGAGAFVVTLPFTLIGGNVGEAGKLLVADPARATFGSPLGDYATISRWPFRYTYND